MSQRVSQPSATTITFGKNCRYSLACLNSRLAVNEPWDRCSKNVTESHSSYCGRSTQYRGMSTARKIAGVSGRYLNKPRVMVRIICRLNLSSGRVSLPQLNLCESETGRFVHTDNLYEPARREVL